MRGLRTRLATPSSALGGVQWKWNSSAVIVVLSSIVIRFIYYSTDSIVICYSIFINQFGYIAIDNLVWQCPVSLFEGPVMCVFRFKICDLIYFVFVAPTLLLSAVRTACVYDASETL